MAGTPYIKPGLIMKSLIGPIMIRTGRVPVLTVEGRVSGQPRSVPIGAPVEVDGHKYLLSARGKTHWILNLRAAGCGSLRSHGVTESFRAVEVLDEERDRVIATYRATYGKSVQQQFEKLPNAADHPTFRLEEMAVVSGPSDKGR
jgi:deazaflavin-dependent oxidoreductase (nitroreductase family)